MPRFKGVYQDASGWYFKARTSKDPLTGKWTQVTRRGFATATEASQARHQLLDLAAAAVTTASETGDASSHCRHTTWKEVKTRRRPLAALTQLALRPSALSSHRRSALR